MKRRIPIRRLEQERLAALKARERRRRNIRVLKWSVLLFILGVIVASITYGVFFTRYTALRKMLPMPTNLESVVFNVNGVDQTVPAQGTLVVHPSDVVAVEDIQTNGKFNWGLRLNSSRFAAEQLLEGRKEIGKFWPQYKYEEPLKVEVQVMAGNESIGGFHMVVRLRARDWVEKAQATKNLDEKVKYYERAARLAPQNALILHNLARLYAEQGQWQKAAAVYEKVAASSTTAPILRDLIEAYQKAGDTDAALDAYLRLIRMGGSDKEPFYGFISYVNAKKNPKEAAAYLSAKLDAFPKPYQPEVHAYLGTLHGQQGQWKQAIEAYKVALDGGVDDPVIHLNLGEAYSRIGRYRQAAESLRNYLGKKPGDLDARFRLVEVYRRWKKYREAIKVLKGIIEEKPEMLKAHLALVDLYEKLKMDKEAAKTYEDIARLAPDNEVVHYNRGVLYYEMKQYDRAAEAFSKVLKLDSRDIDAREYLLRIYTQQDKPRQALAVMEELVKLRPTHWEYYPRLFKIYDKLEAYEEMTKTFARAVGNAPDRPELRSFLGIAYEKRGLLVEAIRQFEAALKLAPGNKDYLNHVAGLYEQIGKKEAALKTYERVLEVDPDDSRAQENYLRLKLESLQPSKTS